ncbi:hypothetical protein GCM10023194_72980 [Planotetraspora phitsanulokensis]|uniref:Uncharacterized protein n=1 Tax=Planotetraspora phitsanulokensis TaxID=575192 RepID=A0A8J3XI41_9ACTN|nr:hypothetical protein [Planotetraspora phitsanulokensis]GII37203.1 hypothetical protein Pph01_22060 [Planotetraspora phitsanulokensis]
MAPNPSHTNEHHQGHRCDKKHDTNDDHFLDRFLSLIVRALADQAITPWMSFRESDKKVGMTPMVIVLALVIVGMVAGVLGVLVVGIHIEDRRKSITDQAPGLITAGTRRVLGLSIDHSACHYVTNPSHSCEACRRIHADRV